MLHVLIFNGRWIVCNISQITFNSWRARRNGHHFAGDVLKLVFLNDSNSAEICPQLSNAQWSSIGTINGLTTFRRQASIWTNDGLVWWHIYLSLRLNGSRMHTICMVASYLPSFRINCSQPDQMPGYPHKWTRDRVSIPSVFFRSFAKLYKYWLSI